MEALTWIWEHGEELLAILAALVTAASVITKLTPTPKDDEVLRVIVAWISALHPKGAGWLKMPLTPPRKSEGDDRRGPPAGGGTSLLLVVTCFVMAPLVNGCAGAAAEIHARAAHATTESLTGAGELIRERRHHEQLEAVQAHEYREDAREAVDQVRQRWAPVIEGYEAVRTAANTWRAALLVYIIDGEEHPELWLSLAGEVVQHWRSWVELGERIGADIPEPPGLLTALLGGRR